ncbi:MAG: biotin--[acetyl-CoA-carboxylase] ligase [Lachnospiraceae bacterium]|nr:biotin--[acetyl-CoA-carboxylase] ligase [Lachnospiraceae bacterium]
MLNCMQTGKERVEEKLSEKKIRKSLGEKEFIREITILSETDSTNRYLKEQAVHGAAAGTVVLAEGQSAGRGRHGRNFFSPGKKGIYMSVLLRPEIELQKSVRITSMAAVAVARAVERVSGIPAQIKWVNDIFLHGKKVCGILTEAGINYETGILDYAVLGIGVNVGKMEFPEELGAIATSVGNECGQNVSRNILIAEILKELAYWYPSLWDGSFLKESRRRSVLLGKEILVVDTLEDGGSYTARAVDLDDMGHLLIERDGKRQELNSGEVSIRL